jgi:hypothetical protein
MRVITAPIPPLRTCYIVCNIMALPFQAPSRRGEAWFLVGLTTSFPDILESGVTLSEPQLCGNESATPQCKVFVAPDSHHDPRAPIQIFDDAMGRVDAALRRDEQVLVFRYRGKFHAISHVRAAGPSRHPFVAQTLIVDRNARTRRIRSPTALRLT